MYHYILTLQKILEKMLDRLVTIEAKVSALPTVQITCDNKLVRTLYALRRLQGSATAGMISSLTGRQRAVESHHLTTLCHMNVVTKKRVGRHVVYSLTAAGYKLLGDDAK